MLFLPQSIYETRRQLWSDFEAGKLPGEIFYSKMVGLEPHDFIGLVGTARLRREAGDLAGAAQYCWRAIEANPCVSEPYIDLARTLFREPESQALATALCELGLLKRSRQAEVDEPVDAFDYEKAGLQREVLEKLRGIPASLRDEVFAVALGKERANEPESVTERLRGLRLIDRMLEEGALEAEIVDEILAEGPAIVPLLVGVLRAWAQDYLDEEGDDDVENALALLGEIGSPREIPHLLEFVDLENETAAGAAGWALGRIIERLPEESAKFLESIAAGLSSGERLKVAEQALLFPRFDPASKLLERLSENLDSIPKNELDVFFPMLLVTMAAARGRAGMSLGRAVLRRQAGRLSKAVRRECEDLLTACELEGIPPPPKIEHWTVYEICAGEASWEDDEGEENEEDDEFLPPPAPVRRRATPGRNDPCWCNSGKKYKKCHLDSDEREARLDPGDAKPPVSPKGEFNGLRKSIGEFLGQVLPQRESKQGLEEFFGDEPMDDSEIPFVDWMIHDRVSPTLGQTVMEEFLERRAARLTAREREMVEAWSRSFVGLYEVQQTKAGVGLELKDLIFGGTFFAHDISMSRVLTKWDGLLARVVPGERGTELGGSGLTVPRTQLQRFREWMDDDRKESGLPWREYLKANWTRIRRQSFDAAENWVDSLRVSNTDGEEMLFSKATYTTVDEVAAIGALQLSTEFTDESNEEESAMRFIWLNDEKTVLGNIRVGGGELTLETNSKQRLERGKRLISDVAGASLRHLRDEFTTQKEMKRQAKEGAGNPPSGRSEASEIPKDVRDRIIKEAFEKHYRGWLDTKIPALDGKTPRQAVKTAKGREQTIEILKTIENIEERKRQAGEVYFDVGRLQAELGLD